MYFTYDLITVYETLKQLHLHVITKIPSIFDTNAIGFDNRKALFKKKKLRDLLLVNDEALKLLLKTAQILSSFCLFTAFDIRAV